MSKNKTGLHWLWLSLVISALDLLTKYQIVQHLHTPYEILPIFNLTYAENHGAAFSFLADHDGWQKFLFLAIATVISLGLVIMLKRNPFTKTRENIAYALIIGGAIGNAIDRIQNDGYVVDFLDFHWGIYHYPTFNVADIAICIGAGLILIDNFGNKKSD